MYYSGLYKTIRDLDEKRFYDVAILFLETKGYPNVVIIDGSGDGGRDVKCSWEHVRIQLSVRKDWDNKINSEAKLAASKGAKHFVYVTNRRIREHEQDHFIQERYQCAGEVDITVFDLAAISTALSLPGKVDALRKLLGIQSAGKITATPREIALSNTLLFSTEARELRDNIIESSIKAHVLACEGMSESELNHRVSSDLGKMALGVQVAKAIHRLRSKGDIIERSHGLHLGNAARAQLTAARNDFLQASAFDTGNIAKKYNL